MDYLEFTVVGMRHHGKTAKDLEEAHTLKLVPEPSNTYDRDAIMVFDFSGDMIGYVSIDSKRPILESKDKENIFNRDLLVYQTSKSGTGLAVDVILTI